MTLLTVKSILFSFISFVVLETPFAVLTAANFTGSTEAAKTGGIVAIIAAYWVGTTHLLVLQISKILISLPTLSQCLYWEKLNSIKYMSLTIHVQNSATINHCYLLKER